MAWKLHAIEQTQLRRQHRVDGVGRPKFDFHTGHYRAASSRCRRKRRPSAPSRAWWNVTLNATRPRAHRRVGPLRGAAPDIRAGAGRLPRRQRDRGLARGPPPPVGGGPGLRSATV